MTDRPAFEPPAPPSEPDEPDEADFADGAFPPPVRRGPGPMMRFLVVVFGVLLLGIGRGAFEVGGVFGVIVGVVMDLLGVVIIAIAIGLVEWWARRRKARTAP